MTSGQGGLLSGNVMLSSNSVGSSGSGNVDVSSGVK
jgi:hypothetical protein